MPDGTSTPIIEASALFDGASEARRVRVLELTPRGALLQVEPPHPPPESRVVLWLARHPDHVPALVARIDAREGSPAGVPVRFERLAPSQRRMLATRAGATPDGSATELRRLVRDAPTELAEFCGLHPYPFLLAASAPERETPSLRADDLVYLVRSRRSPNGTLAPVHVGRDAQSDITIDDERISRQHAAFDHGREWTQYVLLDKGSRNGTRVDWVPLRPMEPRIVTSGSTILFGDLPFVFLSSKNLFSALTISGLFESEGTGLRSP